MSTTRKNIELPVQYKVVQMLTCDGCGLEVESPGVDVKLGWLQLLVQNEDGQGGISTTNVSDFCPDCRPKIERAHTQEATAIRAEKVAARADVSGVA